MTKSSKSGVGGSSQTYFSANEAMDDIGIKKTAFFKYRHVAGIKPQAGLGGRVRYTRQEVDTIREAYEVEKGRGGQENYSADSSRTTQKEFAECEDSTDKARKTSGKQEPEVSQKSPDGGLGNSLEKELREQITHFKKEAQEKGNEVRDLNERLIKTAGDFGRIETQNQFLLLEITELRKNVNGDHSFGNGVSEDIEKSRFAQANDIHVRDAEFTNISGDVPETEDTPVGQGRGVEPESKAAQKKTPQNEERKERGKKREREREREKRKNEEVVVNFKEPIRPPEPSPRWWRVWAKKAA
jgi:hypothetical protein